MAEKLTPTLNIDGYILFDDNSRRLQIKHSGKIYSYDAVKGYEIVEDNRRTRGFAAALSLEFLMPDNVRPVKSMKVRVVTEEGDDFVPLVISPTRSNTGLFEKLSKIGRRIIDKLTEVQPNNCCAAAAQPTYADELRSLHALLKEGVITQEEFDAKKKQLLGL